MAGRFLLGVDVGTAGTKAALYDEAGRRLGEGFRPSRLHQERPGWVRQDPDEMYEETVGAIRACLTAAEVRAEEVAAVALGGQMAGICAVDRDWNPATPYDSWLDNRCGPYIAKMKAHQRRIIELTGGYPTFSHGPKILWWKHERPDVWERIHKFVMPAGYVAGRLAGLRGDDAFIDHSYLHFSCLSDAIRRDWSDELLDLFDVPRAKMPRIVEPWEIIGRITARAAKDTGLAEGTPIAAGSGDTTSSLLGSGIVRPGLALDVAGSASVFAVCVDDLRPDVESQTMFTARHAAEDVWYALAYVNGGGLNLKWFRDTFGGGNPAQAGGGAGGAARSAAAEEAVHEAAAEDGYARLDRAAAAVPPGADGLLFLPHLSGRVSPSDSAQRGMWAGFSWSHGQGHFYRAMLEAVAFEYAYYLRIERRLFPELDFREAWVMGGGSASALWNGIKADVLDVSYRALEQQEGATLGAAIIAGKAVGIFDELSATAERLARPGPPIEPNAERHRFYAPLVDLYLEAMEGNRELFRGLDRAAASAPGDRSGSEPSPDESAPAKSAPAASAPAETREARAADDGGDGA